MCIRDRMKIPSGEITNYPYLKRIGATGKKIILSTGMSTLDEVREAVKVLRENGAREIVLLHCNTEYPTPMCDVNLLAMKTMQEELGLPVGYSDHTKGIEKMCIRDRYCIRPTGFWCMHPRVFWHSIMMMQRQCLRF